VLKSLSNFHQSIKNFRPWKKQDRIEKALNLPRLIQAIRAEPVKKEDQGHPSAAYMELKELFHNLGRMTAIIETLGRDFLTAMPAGAYISRLGQIAFLYRRMHDDITEKHYPAKLSEAQAHAYNNPADWDAWDLANLREMETIIRHNINVPSALIEKRARLSYEGRHVHRDVLKNNDWDQARIFLEGMIDLQQRIADSKQVDETHHAEYRYQSLLREYMPGIGLETIDILFAEYKKAVDNLLPKIIDDQASREAPIELDGVFSGKSQMWLNRTMLKLIGFDFERGGLYETGHNPVEGGTPDDTRLVIKTAKIGTFFDSLKSALHEGGHGIYIQGLPRKEWRYQPVGQDLGALVHESQALLIEMILGRKREFFDFLAPRAEGVFQRFNNPSMSSGNLWRLKNRVNKTLDRKSSDEVTYFLHIYMRTHLERQMISGDLAVKDLPEAWAAQCKTLFGKRPASPTEGCLQDVHWFVGKVGYFPSYALGHMMAAQLYEALLRDIPHLPALLQTGNFADIHQWLNEKIYSKGRLQRTDELIRSVTGDALSVDPLIRHIKHRYLS